MSRQITYGLGGYDATKPNNNIVEEIELPDPVPQPLSPVGALATLLVVNGTLAIDDAANAVGLTPDDLVTEAQAWWVASQTT